MKKQIKLTLLSLMLFSSAALCANNDEGSVQDPVTPVKTNCVKSFVCKSGTFFKDAFGKKYVQVGASLVLVGAVVAVGCYIYGKVTAEETATH